MKVCLSHKESSSPVSAGDMSECDLNKAPAIVRGERAMARQAQRARLEALSGAPGAPFFFLGLPQRLEVSHSVWQKIVHEEGVLRVALHHHDDAGRVEKLVKEWLLKQAQVVLARAFEEMLRRFGGRLRNVTCPLVMRSSARPDGLRLTVRSMKTRWGSCSRDGHVTLSAELVHVPPRLIDYVVVHELCHLSHLDHSRAFYFQLASCLPDWKERRRELAAQAWRQVRVAP